LDRIKLQPWWEKYSFHFDFFSQTPRKYQNTPTTVTINDISEQQLSVARGILILLQCLGEKMEVKGVMVEET